MMIVAQIKDRLDQRRSKFVIFDHPCLFPVCNEIVDRVPFASLHETQMTNAALCGPDEALSEWRGMDPIADSYTRAARFVFTWRHSLCGDKKVVQASQA